MTCKGVGAERRGPARLVCSEDKNLKIQTVRERLLASTMICSALALSMSATGANAQATAPAPAAAPAPDTSTTVQEVVVTGSRIPQPNLTSTSPLTVVNDQELKLQGTTNVETLLNNLPQAFADFGGDVSNGSTGTATVNLRGLGCARTLVLVDGRRVVPGDPIVPCSDLNNIPAALVDRVEVVSGGASAVYGSDAIAGVVNFIMKRDFEGVRLDAQYSIYQNNNDNAGVQKIIKASPFTIPLPSSSVWDGGVWDVTAVIGANSPDGKGNVEAYAGYRNTQAVKQSQRDYTDCAVATGNHGNPNPYIYDTQACFGSSNSAFGRFLPDIGGSYSTNPNGNREFVPFTNAYRYNFAPTNYLQRNDERYTAGAFAHYEINKMIDVYSDIMFSDDHTDAQIAPSGLFIGTGSNKSSTYGINCDNPLMTPDQATKICGEDAGTSTVAQSQIGFRFASLPRTDDLRHTTYSITLGSKGELATGWNYDAYLKYSDAIYNEHYLNDVSISHVQNALLVDPVTGKCTTDTANCVPLDIFAYNHLTPAMIGYVVTPGFKSGSTTEQVISVSLTGDLGQYGMKSPMASDGIGVALGSEYRREALELNVDNEFSSGDLSGQGGPTPPNAGSFDVYELFGEVRVPLVQDMPGIKDLSFDGGYRFSQYSSRAGATSTYKLALDYAPVADIRLRASYNRAVRAPNVAELYTPDAIGLFSGVDPCANGPVTADSANYAQCLKTFDTSTPEAKAKAISLLANGIGQCPAAQCSALLGGNPNLQAEVSDTYSVGFVFTPTFFKGFNLSVDYFDIKVAKLISSLPFLKLISCVNGADAACTQIDRDPSNGILYGSAGSVFAIEENTGYLKTTGIDMEANYRSSFSDWGMPDYGSLALNLVGTYTKTYTTQPDTGGGTFECAGFYGPVCGGNAVGGPIAKWRHKFRITWVTPWPVTVSMDWRHISGVKLDQNETNPFLKNPFGLTDLADAKIPAYDWLDVSGTWRVKDGMTLRFGVNNLLDKDPPIVDQTNFPASGPPFGNGNTFPGTYDSLGRQLFIGITADF